MWADCWWRLGRIGGCDASPPRRGDSYRWQLNVHCGVDEVDIDGRAFYVDRPTGLRSSDVGAEGGPPVIDGTMNLVYADEAVFHGDNGIAITFVDHLPVVVGQAYSVSVIARPDAPLDSVFFAGGLFVQAGLLSGHLAQGTSGTLNGTMTLIDRDHATLALDGASIRYVRSGPVGCM